MLRSGIFASTVLLVFTFPSARLNAQDFRPIPPGQLVPDDSADENDEDDAQTDDVDARDLFEVHPLMRGQRSNSFRTLGFATGSLVTTWLMFGACWLDSETTACTLARAVTGLTAVGFLASYGATIYFSHEASRALRRLGADVGPGLLYAGAGLVALTAVSAPLAQSAEAEAWTAFAGVVAFLSPYLQAIANRWAYGNLARRTQVALTPQLERPGLQLSVRW